MAATSELIKQSEDTTTLEDRSLLVALLSLSERLNTQRFLIQDALVTGDPVSEELLLQLEVESDSLSQNFFEASRWPRAMTWRSSRRSEPVRLPDPCRGWWR